VGGVLVSLCLDVTRVKPSSWEDMGSPAGGEGMFSGAGVGRGDVSGGGERESLAGADDG